jgi:hypothetical protein
MIKCGKQDSRLILSLSHFYIYLFKQTPLPWQAIQNGRKSSAKKQLKTLNAERHLPGSPETLSLQPNSVAQTQAVISD